MKEGKEMKWSLCPAVIAKAHVDTGPDVLYRVSGDVLSYRTSHTSLGLGGDGTSRDSVAFMGFLLDVYKV
jgi:hypothetical protein